MKLLTIILLMLSFSVGAMNKCIIDGKTVYQQGACPVGTDKEIKGAFSVNETSGVRRSIEIDNAIKAKEAQRKAEQVKSAQDNQLMEKLNSIEAKVKKTEQRTKATQMRQMEHDILYPFDR